MSYAPALKYSTPPAMIGEQHAYHTAVAPPVLMGRPARQTDSKQDMLRALRRRIASIEKRPLQFETSGDALPECLAPTLPLWRLGIGEIDKALPAGRLSPKALHDIGAADYADGPAASGFCLALLRQLLNDGAHRPDAPRLWCQTARTTHDFGFPYGPGLSAFGIGPDRVILVTVSRDQDVLWAMEEGIRARSLSAVVGEVAAPNFTATRRLSLAATENETPCLLLRRPDDGTASAAQTRWRVASLPAAPDDWDIRAPGRARWRLSLTRSRGGRSGTWDVEWNHATHTFRLAAPLAGRTTQPGQAPRQADQLLQRTG